MRSISTRTSGLAATAAVHIALAAVLLAGWQVSRHVTPRKPIILVPVPPQPVEPRTIVPPTSDLPVTVTVERPSWTEANPDPVVAPPLGPPVGTGAGGDEVLARGDGEPTVVAPPVGPSRAARLIGGRDLQPPYPPAARALGEEGSVTIAVSIAADGSVTGVSLVRSSGFARLDAAAIDFARRRWRFEPALDRGSAVATTRNFTIRFTLD